jgi:hypothetical protein
VASRGEGATGARAGAAPEPAPPFGSSPCHRLEVARAVGMKQGLRDGGSRARSGEGGGGSSGRPGGDSGGEAAGGEATAGRGCFEATAAGRRALVRVRAM